MGLIYTFKTTKYTLNAWEKKRIIKYAPKVATFLTK